MGDCIDTGLATVQADQETIRRQAEVIREVAATVDPQEGRSVERESDFGALSARLAGDGDPIHEHMAQGMTSFQPGLFAGGDALDGVRDNLDLERKSRLPKSHERRIHGHRHAGVRIVQEGATLVLALDAHAAHPGPFGVEDLRAYRSARMPGCQRQALSRRKVMRKARSPSKRPKLLAELERRYLADF